MNATLSTRQLRLVGLLVGIVILAAGYLVVSRHKSTSPSPAVSTLVSTTPAATTPTQTTPTSKAHTHTVTPVKLETHGLPVRVARALTKHSIVVVTLASPRGAAEQLAAGEARYAANAMGAGYVYINVFHQRPGTTLLRKLGVFSTPTTLVVKRPGNVYSEFKGFVDRNVVEQAIADAHS
jgi:thiol:disulfide interchange protein